ncbi:MAG: hypothetical protein WC449_04755 [Candidatus Paceibacterota bacterium]
MCNKTNLPDRVEKAKAAINFAKVSQYDTDGKVKSVLVPGSEGKQYQVIIRRSRGVMSTELLLVVNNQTVKPTYAKNITYHSLTAVMIAAKEQGYNVTWTVNREDAVRLSRIGGTVFHIYNFDNPQELMWGVMRTKEK